MNYYIRLKARKECYLVDITGEKLNFTSVKSDIRNKAALSRGVAHSFKDTLENDFNIKTEIVNERNLDLESIP